MMKIRKKRKEHINQEKKVNIVYNGFICEFW